MSRPRRTRVQYAARNAGKRQKKKKQRTAKTVNRKTQQGKPENLKNLNCQTHHAKQKNFANTRPGNSRTWGGGKPTESLDEAGTERDLRDAEPDLEKHISPNKKFRKDRFLDPEGCGWAFWGGTEAKEISTERDIARSVPKWLGQE